MSEPRAPIGTTGRRRRLPPIRPRDLLAPALAAIALASTVWGQAWPTAPPIAADLRAALDQADAGKPDDLVKLADGGRADAQFYAGVMFLSKGAAPTDGAKGCSYEERASASRADAMYMVGRCYQHGLGGQQDAGKAKAAFARAAEMGLPKAKCALGEMLMAEPQEARRGLGLCEESARAGEVDAQVKVGDVYFSGGATKPDHAEARKWYDMAAKQQNPAAARKLGTMYAKGDGGRRDPKRAMELWLAAEKGGDPLVSILVADQLFSDLTGGRTPGPGKYAFKGGIPVKDIEVIEDWYREAQKRDPRPDVQERAKLGLSILGSFKSAAEAVPKR